ncbi:MAG: hypothetical protein ABSB76_02435 [Streptosporangiaceae bacterium]|jgi:hypothetical protein
MLALIARAADPGDEEEAAPGEAGTLFGAAEVTGVDVFAAIRDEPRNVSVKTSSPGSICRPRAGTGATRSPCSP